MRFARAQFKYSCLVKPFFQGCSLSESVEHIYNLWMFQYYLWMFQIRLPLRLRAVPKLSTSAGKGPVASPPSLTGHLLRIPGIAAVLPLVSGDLGLNRCALLLGCVTI